MLPVFFYMIRYVAAIKKRMAIVAKRTMPEFSPLPKVPATEVPFFSFRVLDGQHNKLRYTGRFFCLVSQISLTFAKGNLQIQSIQ